MTPAQNTAATFKDSLLDFDQHTAIFLKLTRTMMVREISHFQFSTTLATRPPRCRRGRFVSVVQQLECENFENSFIHEKGHSSWNGTQVMDGNPIRFQVLDEAQIRLI